MDVLMLKISTKILKIFIGKMLSKQLGKKLGCNIKIQLNDLNIDAVKDDIKIHVDIDGLLTKDDFYNVINELGKGE